jgi:hypothetical protein
MKTGWVVERELVSGPQKAVAELLERVVGVSLPSVFPPLEVLEADAFQKNQSSSTPLS